MNHNWILKEVKSCFFYFMYLLLMKFAFKISPVVLFGLTYVYKGCLGYLSIAGLHFLIQVNS